MHLITRRIVCGLIAAGMLAAAVMATDQPASAPASGPAATQAIKGPVKHTDPGRIYDKENGFSIVPPEGYVSKGAMSGAFVFLMGPDVGHFRLSINVTVSADTGEKPEELGEQMKAAFKKILTDYAVAGEGYVTIDGKKSYWLSNTFSQGPLKLRTVQYFVRGNNKKTYAVTCASTAEAFEKYRQSFQDAALSVKTD
jgi:hypothetical protein